MLSILSFLLLGATNGLIAGTLGIGGGSFIIPFLVIIFSSNNVEPAHIQHIAVATSMASITTIHL